MKNSCYKIVPIHQRPDLFLDCCNLINAEWPSSNTRRLRTLGMSCDNFPTCLVLLNNDKVIGHCKISLVPNLSDSCFIESVVIDYEWRSQGLGSSLLRGTEEYILSKGLKNIYLATKGQEVFYIKNGYRICEPINLFNCGYVADNIVDEEKKITTKIGQFSSGPTPPPLPKIKLPINNKVITTKTYMIKNF
ncbi:N-alpha-acetyltransferase 80 isoform X2 [Aphidius gifuensis]|nr:N-alpha-acetyltransferase 80 isoform X2 [Aphidius gifuensis]